jgi:hypothetical protein
MRSILLEDRRLPIFPCRPDKRPTCPHGFKDASADPKAIAQLWLLYPGPLIGVPTGAASGLAVIDIDSRHGGDRWFHQHRDRIPLTRVHETQGGGLHLLFRHKPGLRCSNGRIAPGVDIKGDGGYIIWWPARSCRVLCEGPVAEFPAWLRAELSAENLSSSDLPTRSSRGDAAPLVEGRVRLPRDLYLKVIRLCPIGAGVTRHDQRRLCGILSIATRRTKDRNEGLYNAAVAMRDLIGIIDRKTAIELLLNAAQSNGYLAKDGVQAALATIRSGLTPPRPTEEHPPLAEETVL